MGEYAQKIPTEMILFRLKTMKIKYTSKNLFP